jgi:MFS family permease
MVNVAIPLIREQFGISEPESGWVITGYALTFAVGIPLYGRVSDMFSLRRTFAVGASPYLVATGLLLLRVGYAGTNSPAANAASGAIPREVAGTGLGIYQLFFFLGSGAGPAVLGVFLASRRGVPGGAINPLYSLQATPFSDAFLLAALAVTMALLAATRLDGKPQEQVKG